MRKLKEKKKIIIQASWVDDAGNPHLQLFDSWSDYNNWQGSVYARWKMERGINGLEINEIENIWSDDSDAEEGEWLDE